jgi:hypothetical protein
MNLAEKAGSDAGLRLVRVNLTRPITVWALWNLSGSDLTLRGGESGQRIGASGR